MRISNLSLGLVDTNAYFVESDNSVLLVDPAGESDKIFKKLNQINKPLKAILLTHAHFDHIGALTMYYPNMMYLFICIKKNFLS